MALTTPAAVVATLRPALSSNIDQFYITFQAKLDQLLAYLNGYVGQIQADSANSYHQLSAIMVAIMVIGAALSLLIGQFIMRMIVKPLDATVAVIQSIAQGDLRPRDDFAQRFQSKDAFGRLAQTSASSEEVSAAIEEITAQMLEATTATQELARAAQALQGSVTVFRLEDEAPTSLTAASRRHLLARAA